MLSGAGLVRSGIGIPLATSGQPCARPDPIKIPAHRAGIIEDGASRFSKARGLEIDYELILARSLDRQVSRAFALEYAIENATHWSARMLAAERCGAHEGAAQSTNKALDEDILLRLARLDVVPGDTTRLLPL